MFNRTHLEHVVIAVGIQLALCPFVGIGAGGAVAAGVFVGREYGQAEYKMVRATGRSLTEALPWHVLRAKYWTVDAVLDWVLPVIACGAIWAIWG